MNTEATGTGEMTSVPGTAPAPGREELGLGQHWGARLGRGVEGGAGGPNPYQARVGLTARPAGGCSGLELISSHYVRVHRAKAMAQKTEDGKCGLSRTVLNSSLVSVPQESGKGRLLKSCLQKVSKENLLAAIKPCIT